MSLAVGIISCGISRICWRCVIYRSCNDLFPSRAGCLGQCLSVALMVNVAVYTELLASSAWWICHELRSEEWCHWPQEVRQLNNLSAFEESSKFWIFSLNSVQVSYESYEEDSLSYSWCSGIGQMGMTAYQCQLAYSWWQTDTRNFWFADNCCEPGNER